MPASMDLSDSQPPGHTVFSSPQHPATVVTTPPTSNPSVGSPPCNGSGHNGLPRPQKRTRLQFSLLSEGTVPQAAWDPRKKVKTVHTSVSVQRSREVDDLHTLRMLELARASQKTFDAHLKYRRLRLQEIEVMRTIAIDECEEAASWTRKAESQIGELRHILHVNGAAIGESGIRLFGSGQDEDVGGSISEAGYKERSFRSPTPSDRDDDNGV